MLDQVLVIIRSDYSFDKHIHFDSQASKDVSHFYAAWDLMEVTTLINLLSVVTDLSGKNLGEADVNYSSGEFFNLIDKVFNFFDGLKKWEDYAKIDVYTVCMA